MKCDYILSELEKIMPLSYALSWDNVGLLVGSSDKEAKKIVIGLDLTEELIDFSISVEADLIITHHPMIFSPLKKIVDTDFIGRRIIKLIKNDISYIAMHTNYDTAINCMSDLAAEKLGIKGVPIEVTGEDISTGIAIGIGKVGQFKEKMKLKELAAHIKEAFKLDFIRIYGSDILKEGIDVVAILPGSGKGMYRAAKQAGAKLLITGDITHHEGIDAREEGIAIIDAGHYGIEKIFIDDLENKISAISKEFKIYKFFGTMPDIIL